ncbi:hypothetical protein MKW92_009449 [Papaver armeniacum]|nr:hypothetical protein MKW92_009449 [Papaver armeniacum]
MIFSTLEHILTHISFSIVSIVITIYLMTLLGMIATFFCITGLLVTRWIYSEHFPLSDLYESLIFLSWGFSIIHMVPKIWNHKNDLSAITAPSTIFTQGFATSGLLTEMHQSTILVPALQSQWLMMHVSMMILSYAALLCGSLLSVSLLVITFRKSLGVFGKNNHSLIGLFSFDFDEIQYAWGSYWNWDPKETWAFITWTISWKQQP